MGNTKNAFGKPIYSDEFALPQDLQDGADFAEEFAWVRGGTSSERQALPVGKQRPGMLWVETDEDRRLMSTDGAGGWTLAGSTPWVPIPLSTGWTAVSGHTPRARLINGVVYMEGAATRNAGGSLSNIGVIPSALRHLQNGNKTVFVGAHVANRSGTTAVAEVYVNNDGTIRCDGYTNIDGNVGWIVPISGMYVRDQR